MLGPIQAGEADFDGSIAAATTTLSSGVDREGAGRLGVSGRRGPRFAPGAS